MGASAGKTKAADWRWSQSPESTTTGAATGAGSSDMNAGAQGLPNNSSSLKRSAAETVSQPPPNKAKAKRQQEGTGNPAPWKKHI